MRSHTVFMSTNLYSQIRDASSLASGAFRSDLHLANWWDGVCRNPDAEDCDVDASNRESGAPFELDNCTPVFCDDGNSVDDYLHKHLDFENPEA